MDNNMNFYNKLFISVFFIIFLSFFDIAYAHPLDEAYEIRPTQICFLNREDEKNIKSMQGVYFYDHYALYVNASNNDGPTRVVLVDLNSCSVIDISEEKSFGHGNDLTYNSKEKKFYIIPSSKTKLAYGFKVENNKIILDDSSISTNIGLYAIDYDNDNDQYYIATGGNIYSIKSLKSLDSEKKLIGTTFLEYDNVPLVKQGISYYNGNIYEARTISESSSSHYNDSYVIVRDANTGEYKYSMHFPRSYFEGHLEGITVIENKIYFGINVHKPTSSGSALPEGSANTNTKRGQAFLVYDGINQYEQEYNMKIKKMELVQNGTIYIEQGDSFNYHNLKIKNTHNNGDISYVELNELNSTLTGFNNNIIGEQVVKITYEKVEYECNVVIVEKCDYKILEGENQNYTIGKSEDLVFRINANYQLFINGGKILVDGEVVNSLNYDVKDGSTIIKLKTDYLNNISVGEHTLNVIFSNNKSSNIKFTTSGQKKTDVVEENPKTGHYFSLFFILFPLIAIILVLILKKRMIYFYKL